MQNSPNEIKEQLLRALDKDNNVVDMAGVLDVITLLEKTQITKEALEKTRLGKLINELRKKTKNGELAKRAKELVRKWQKLIMPSAERPTTNGERTLGHPAPGGYVAFSTVKPASPALTNHRLHHAVARASSPLAPNSPLSWHDSSTSTSPALLNSGHQGSSRPNTPVVGTQKGRVTSPEGPSTSDHHHVVSSASSSSRSHGVNHTDHNFRRQVVSPSVSENDYHRPSRHKGSKPTSPIVAVTDKAIRSSHSLSVDNVAKTNAANKRLRKDDESAYSDIVVPAKRACVDGKKSLSVAKVCSTKLANGIVDLVEKSNDSSSNHHPFLNENSQDHHENETTKVPNESSNCKRDANKISKQHHRKEVASDSLKEKLATHARIPKVKTTAQLIEELKARNTNVTGPTLSPAFNATACANASLFGRRPVNNVLGSAADQDVTKSKTELMEKFLRSSADSGKEFDGSSCSQFDPAESSPRGSRSAREAARTTTTSTAPAVPNVPDEVEAILASLPVINKDEINWSEDDYEPEEVEPKIEPVTDAAVNKLLTDEWEGMNGNMDHEQKFKEWREVLSRRSYGGEPLHILPYVNTD